MFMKKRLSNLQQFLDRRAHIIRYDFYVLVLLLFLSILGIGLTDAFGKWSKWYWLTMIPVFYGCNLFIEWQKVKNEGVNFMNLLIRQAQYWIGLLGAVYLTFFLEQLGTFNNETTGMILLLILALSIFQTGIATGWLFQLLGVFLGLCLMIVAYVENYTWSIVALTIICLVAYFVISAQFERLKHRDERL